MLLTFQTEWKRSHATSLDSDEPQRVNDFIVTGCSGERRYAYVFRDADPKDRETEIRMFIHAFELAHAQCGTKKESRNG